jgi:nicotinate-nucleotide--dimethylbenzimidazole phosphoribosyltransferase
VRDRDEIAARTVIALLTRREASTVLGQPVGMPDREWMAACAAVRDRMAEVVEHRGEPLVMLAALGATSIAAVAGSLLAASARRTPCLVDGTDELAAALVADRLCYRAKGWWRAGSDSPDPGRAAAVERIDLSPGLPLGLTDDAGKGAQATLALLGELAD